MSIDITQYPETVEAFGGNEQRAKVFLDRYATKNERGEVVERDPEEMWQRVARGIAGEGNDSHLRAQRYYDLLAGFKFVPGGRILSSAGTGTETTYYNCYVVPVETKVRRQLRDGWDVDSYEELVGAKDTGNDSREAIIDTVGVMVDIMSRGGGVGINWSVLRPKGAHLKRINATSSGPVDWMHFASTAVGTVEQGGSRRGAAMFMLDDWHPDVLEFIDAKRNLDRITNANVSVAVSDYFMEMVASDGDWTFGFPDTSDPHYDAEWDGNANGWLAKGYGWKAYQTVKAREVWRKLAEAAWDNGEPGVVFLDRYNKLSTGAGVERLISVNPCGEQGLGPYSVCNLGSMNLAAYVERDHSPYRTVFDFVRFGRDVTTAVEFLDEVIDRNYYFLPENEQVQKDLRRIGLGVMGLADALVMLGLRYGSPEAVAFTEQVFRTMKERAVVASANLAVTKGVAPAWQPTMMDRPYLYDLPLHIKDHIGEAEGLRNVFLLTQAPTGTTSILAGVNSGIEPFFALGYWREDRTGKHWVAPDALKPFLVGMSDGDFAPAPSFVVTANDVTVEEHIAMQAAVQKYVDSSVSKTINAPNSHTVEDVERAYTLAYESGLKGLAYFRDGCGRAQVLSTGSVPDKAKAEAMEQVADEVQAELVATQQRVRELEAEVAKLREKVPVVYERPDVLSGKTHKVKAGSQTAYVTVNRDDDNEPVEVFVSVGKSGSEMMAMGEAMGRLISIGLQSGLTLLDIEEQLAGVGNSGFINRSLPSAIASALKDDIEQAGQASVVAVGQVIPLEAETFTLAWDPKGVAVLYSDTELPTKTLTAPDLCPDCGALSLVREEGCKKCHACGYSAC